MEYQCILSRGNRKEKWTGSIRLISHFGAVYEAEVTGRGTYFHLIAGKHLYGNYLCIPNHDVGSELSAYSDVFWNTERLSRLMRKVDAVTVACALIHLPELGKPEEAQNI